MANPTLNSTIEQTNSGIPFAHSVCRSVVIKPSRSLKALDPCMIWEYRELWWALILRDLKVRYKQTLLGTSWAVIQPLVTMIVLHIFFGKFMGLSDRVGELSYPIFLYAGLLPWTLLAGSVNAACNSFVNNASIISKVYFPRLILPLSAVMAPVVDFAIAFAVLLGMMVYFNMTFTVSLVLLPLIIVSVLIVVLGVGITLATLTVKYRDVKHAVPFVLQIWFFVTPVIYPLTFIPEQYQWVLYLNPMSGVIETMRSIVLDQPINYGAWATSVVGGLIFLIVGLLWFSHAERQFADII